ncbi:hypothetical protein DFR50_109134 [Roseiarcus fermentans]|uniref:Uncharacterized protein n=1 Tax=Roseiarcus fermentans TaxID=1473586 RepID=A0A366FK77_9HYPH|nr:hypothetical protein [Roseiarcus fermentans]RBP14380.1 hypothetical protein DFR50_109134 [Roseiarcus fermentans]
MAWGAVIVCGLVLWAASGGVLALGREIWPAEMPEAVRLAVAPALAAAATLADKLATPLLDPLLRAVALTAIVGTLDAFLIAPLIVDDRVVLRAGFAYWAPLAAILCASWLTGRFGPM